MRLNIDQITVYQSLLINKANVNRGSRNGMTCSIYYSLISFSRATPYTRLTFDPSEKNQNKHGQTGSRLNMSTG